MREIGSRSDLRRSLGTRSRGTGTIPTAGKVAERAAKRRGVVPIFNERRARDLAVNAWTCDVSGTEKALGWRAQIPLYEGLECTVRWYRKAGWPGIKF